MKLQASGIVDEFGKLTLTAEKKFKSDLKIFSKKPVIITIEKKSRKRSVQQNRYLHGVVIPIVKQGLYEKGFRMTDEQVKDLLKLRFLKTDIVNEDTGECIEIIKNTSSLTTSEMMDFVAQIQEWASEYLGIYVPDPSEHVDIN